MCVCVFQIIQDCSTSRINCRNLNMIESTEQHACGGAVDQLAQCQPRELSDEEKLKLEKDKKVVSEFKQNKLEKEALKNWDLFYKRNSTKFFKDRHWTTREFQDLCDDEV